MQNNQSVIHLAIQGVIAAALAVVALFVVFNGGTVIRMWGINTCYTSSVTEVKNTDGSSWSGPSNAILEECLKTKNVLE